MFVGGLSMTLAVGIFAGYDALSTIHRLARDLQALADFVATESAPFVAEKDVARASVVLRQAVSVNTDVASVSIVLPDGTVFARYDQPGAVQARTTVEVDPTLRMTDLPWRALTASALGRRRPIVFGGRPVGAVFISSTAEASRSRAIAFLQIILAVLVLTFGMSLLASIRMQRLVSLPIVDLTATAQAVTREHRYDVRGRKDGDDEIGQLVDSFNAMMDEIQVRDGQLLQQQDDLERTVDRSTAQLQAANEALVRPTRRPRSQPGEERVPRQHEPRDPDADERHHRHDRARARHATSRAEQREHLLHGADVGRIAARDPQRHPRLLEDRSRQARARVDRRSRCAMLVEDALKPLSVRADQKGLELIERHRAGCAAPALSATPSASARSSSISSATPSSSPSAAT